MTAQVAGENVTPLGIYLLAHSYHQAADIIAADRRISLSDGPARLLYLHASESYLRCFLRSQNMSPTQIKKFNHHLDKMLSQAKEMGLKISVKSSTYIASASTENDYVRARYDIDMRSPSWPPEKKKRTTSIAALAEVVLELQKRVKSSVPIVKDFRHVLPGQPSS